MLTVKIEIWLELGQCNGAMQVDFSDQHGASCITQSIYGQHVISAQIRLPNRIMIDMSGKNYKIDTQTDHDGKILHNKYVELKSLVLGGMKFRHDVLQQISEYYADGAPDPIFSTLWDRNGRVIMDFFDKDPITTHLHWNSVI